MAIGILNREPAWPDGKALGWETEGRRFDSPLRLSFLFKNCVWTLSRDFAPCTINETLKWLTSLAHLSAEIILVVTV